MASHSISPSVKMGGPEKILREGFAKCEIKTSVFSEEKP